MRRHYLVWAIALLAALGFGTAAAQAAGPAADYKLDPEYTSASPDGATTIEQYSKEDPNGGSLWQFWARRGDKLALLDREDADYPAGFRFTNDSQWLMRMQKTGSGEATLYLYWLRYDDTVATTPKPIGDLAWDFFNSRPESRRIMKPDFHMVAGLAKGTEENYRWLRVRWPDNRYIVIMLSGEVSPNGRHGQIRSVDGWRCRYELLTGKFDVPASFAKNNAKAIVRQYIGRHVRP